MKYILSWIIPLTLSVGFILIIAEYLPEIGHWYFSVPLSGFLALVNRDFFIDIYGTHITYSIKLKQDDINE